MDVVDSNAMMLGMFLEQYAKVCRYIALILFIYLLSC